MKKIMNVLFILVLGILSAFLLLKVEALTVEKIKQNRERELKNAILEAASIDYKENQVFQVFDKNIRKKMVKTSDNEFEYYLSPDDLYIFEFEGRGLWGMIEGVMALKPDLETIKSIRIISQKETPGLGGRISEESFLSQFEKKKVSPQLPLILKVREKAKKINEIDAITGATMTSSALIDMLNKSVLRIRRNVE